MVCQQLHHLIYLLTKLKKNKGMLCYGFFLNGWKTRGKEVFLWIKHFYIIIIGIYF